MRIAYRNFTGGEAVPSLAARYDLKKSGTFLQTCLNCIPNLHGDIERRPGTELIGILGEGSKAVLLPFAFNSEAANNYVLALTEGSIKVAQAGRMLDAEMENPYPAKHWYGLSTAQVADVMYVAHKGHPFRKICRSTPDAEGSDDPGQTPAPETPEAAVIIIAGQSNAVGNSGVLGAISAKGSFWWEPSRVLNPGEREQGPGKWESPVKDPVFPGIAPGESGATGGGFVPALVKELRKTKRSIYVINTARGSSNCAAAFDPEKTDEDPDKQTAKRKAANWGPNGDLRARAKKWVDRALNDLDNAGIDYEVLGTVWLQGETDARCIGKEEETQLDYSTTVAATLEYFLANFGGKVFISTISHRTDGLYEDAIAGVNARLRECASTISGCLLATALPETFTAEAGDFAEGSPVHFSQAAYDRLGASIGSFILNYLDDGKDEDEDEEQPEYVWSIQKVLPNKSLPKPGRPDCFFSKGTGAGQDDNMTSTLSYVVTAVDEFGVESVASKAGEAYVWGEDEETHEPVKVYSVRYPTDWIVGDFVDITWPAVDGAVEYNIYRDSAGYYGFIGNSKTTSFRDQNFEPDTAQTPRKNWNPFKNNNYPTSCAFHQQRLWLGGGRKTPSTIIASRTGDYENFRKSSPLQDDDALEYVIASGGIDDIKWIVSFGDLIIGTSGAEYQASASKGGAITPADCAISAQSYWGSRALPPVLIGQSILHCQRAGSHVRDLYYSLESDGYVGNDLSVLAPHLFEGHKLVQWAYQQTPASCLWCVRDDGTLLCLTYMKEQNVWGWSRHVTDGRVVSVAAISGDDEDVVMLAVVRRLGGRDVCCLERLRPRFRDADAIEDAWFVDCGITVEPGPDRDGRAVVCRGLQVFAGREVAVLADGSPERHVVSPEGMLELDNPCSKALVGLPYTSVFAPLPMETDVNGTGSTLGKRRSFGKAVVRCIRSVAGMYAASRPGAVWDPDAWKELEWFEIPHLPEEWGKACKPFSGDVELVMASGQDTDSTLYFRQDLPLPFRVAAVGADVDLGER